MGQRERGPGRPAPLPRLAGRLPCCCRVPLPPPPFPLLLPLLYSAGPWGQHLQTLILPWLSSAAPLLPVADEHHLSSLSLSSTSSRASPLSLTQRIDKGQPWRCGDDPCDGGINRGFPSAFSYLTLGALHPAWPSLRLGQPQ